MDIVMEDSDTEVMEEYWNEHSGEDCIGLETIRHYSFFDTHDVSGFFTGMEDQGQMSTGKGKHWKLGGSLDHYFQEHSREDFEIFLDILTSEISCCLPDDCFRLSS